MVKPLAFKGDPKSKSKKRKRAAGENEDPDSKALTSSGDAPEDNNWVTADNTTDPAGPIMFVLPTEPPTALASDVTGAVFALPIENMIEDDPSTAEPHDVRMVWIITRVAGTDTVTLKSHHGKYLGSDRTGTLSASRDAVGPEESFTIVAAPDASGLFGIKTARDTFLAADSKAKAVALAKVIRADSESIEFSSSLRIRMQARFKPKLKVAKEEKARGKISRKELEQMVGRRLDEDDVKTLKRARREGNFHEKLLDVKVKGKHDKFA